MLTSVFLGDSIDKCIVRANLAVSLVVYSAWDNQHSLRQIAYYISRRARARPHLLDLIGASFGNNTCSVNRVPYSPLSRLKLFGASVPYFIALLRALLLESELCFRGAMAP